MLKEQKVVLFCFVLYCVVLFWFFNQRSSVSWLQQGV